jgi:predicted metal-dependent hydrolase
VSRELHPDLTPEERARLHASGIALFNRGDFYAAHEAWEEIWRSATPEPKLLFQGLVQVAAAMHQLLDLHRTSGPRSTLAKARRNLEPFSPTAEGIDVAALLASVADWQAWLEAPETARPPLPVLTA